MHVRPSLLVLYALAGCAPQSSEHLQSASTLPDPAARLVADRYAAAATANNLDSMAAVSSDSVVFLGPDLPPIEGKAAVFGALAGFYQEYDAQWSRHTVEFVQSGDLAVERYTYRMIETPKKGGAAATAVGKGVFVLRREADGQWRLATNIWNLDPALAR